MNKLLGIDARNGMIAYAGLALFAFFLCGCSTFLTRYSKETTTTIDESNKPKVVENLDVSVWRGKVLADETLDGMNLEYGQVKLGLGAYALKGDAAMGNTIANGIIGGITAYYTAGASSVAKGVVKGMSAGAVTDAVTEAIKEEPEAPAEPVDSAPVVSPEDAKKDTAQDVAPGKYAVVVLGNRKGCPLCRRLWTDTFEKDVEDALPAVDVIDADLTESPKLYAKYFAKDCKAYPYCVIFDASGNRVGAFLARNMDTKGFAAAVEANCVGCKPK